MGTRRHFSREFKLEAVKLVKERGVSAVQAARDLDVHQSVLRKWIRELSVDPKQAFPGEGAMKPEQAEIERSQGVARATGRRNTFWSNSDWRCCLRDCVGIGKV